MGPFTVLHYVGAGEDRGGILTMVRSLAEARLGRTVVWVAPTFRQQRTPRLRVVRGGGPAEETIDARSLCSAAGVAWRLRFALTRGRRIFHGHSRAGLLVGLWLRLFGGERVVVSVHCHGRQRWFYRWAALVLGERMVWLTPAMKLHYDVGARTWAGCQRNFLGELSSDCRPDRRSGSGNRATVGSTADPRVRPFDFAQAPSLSSGDNPPYLRLGGIGALIPWKGWHLVLSALGQLSSADRARVEFWHIGSAGASSESRAYAAELRVLASELGVTENVTWRGEEASSSALLTEVDVLVVPSDGEPFSMALLEAWRAGVPVLAADSGGPGDLITEGRDGWLFANGSAESLAQEISRLLHSDALAHVRPELPPGAPVISRWRALYTEALA